LKIELQNIYTKDNYQSQDFYQDIIYMNEFNHLSPNITYFNSNCAHIQKLFQEYLNPKQDYLDFDIIYEEYDMAYGFRTSFANLYEGVLPEEIKEMNPDLSFITVDIDVIDSKKRYYEGYDKYNVRSILKNEYSNFFKEIMKSIKNNKVYIPIMEDFGLIIDGKDDSFYTKEVPEKDLDLQLTICDYINLEITQPSRKMFMKTKRKNLNLSIQFTMYSDTYFEFILKFNNLVVAKKVLKYQGNGDLNIASVVPLQRNITHVPLLAIYPEDNDELNEVEHRQGIKYRDNNNNNNNNVVHLTNNSRFTKKNEDNSNIPMASDVKKYKPVLNDQDHLFTQLHTNRTLKMGRHSTVKARPQKMAQVNTKVRKTGGRKKKNYKKKVMSKRRRFKIYMFQQ
jgi:hypothetical protein